MNMRLNNFITPMRCCLNSRNQSDSKHSFGRASWTTHLRQQHYHHWSSSGFDTLHFVFFYPVASLWNCINEFILKVHIFEFSILFYGHRPQFARQKRCTPIFFILLCLVDRLFCIRLYINLVSRLFTVLTYDYYLLIVCHIIFFFVFLH